MSETPEQIIKSALALPLDQRAAIVVALQKSLTPNEYEAAWHDEIGHRLNDIDRGRVKTIPSEEAWKIIDGDASSSV